MTAWQPIEAAPKDGAVLLRVPTRHAKWSDAVVCMGAWMGTFWAMLNADEAVQRVEPSHWMQLPPPPEAIDKEAA